MSPASSCERLGSVVSNGTYTKYLPPTLTQPLIKKSSSTHTTRSGHIHETPTLFSNMVPRKRSRKTDSKPRYSGLKHGVRCTMVQKNFYISPCTNNTDSLSAYFGVRLFFQGSSKASYLRKIPYVLSFSSQNTETCIYFNLIVSV